MKHLKLLLVLSLNLLSKIVKDPINYETIGLAQQETHLFIFMFLEDLSGSSFVTLFYFVNINFVYFQL